MQNFDNAPSRRHITEKKLDKTLSFINQKYSEQNSPTNMIQKPRYLTPMQTVKPNHSPRIHGSHRQNEQRDLNSYLLSKKLMKIYATTKLNENIEIPSKDENKILHSLDSTRKTSNNDIHEYDYL